MWRCGKCHEVLEDSFVVCWKCLTERAVEPLGAAELGEAGTRQSTSTTSPRQCGTCGKALVPCPRCHGRGYTKAGEAPVVSPGWDAFNPATSRNTLSLAQPCPRCLAGGWFHDDGTMACGSDPRSRRKGRPY